MGYQAISGKHIDITDPLFSHYVDMIADRVLPYQWEVLNDRVEGAEPSHCLDNFRIAAGELDGTYGGAVFQDTDVYKWLEAVSYCIESGRGEGFTEIAENVIDLIGRAQQPDGYLNTYFTVERPGERWNNLLEGHELYSAGYLIEASVAYFRATGRDSLLTIALRYADLITETFGPGERQICGYPGHQEIELALVKLYRLTGCERYLDTARYFISQRGQEPNYFLKEIKQRGLSGLFPEFRDYDLKYAQAHMPPAEQRSIEGHAVRALYMCAAMADLALETGDEQLRDACTALWESATERRMFITGGLGSSGFLERFTIDYDLPNSAAYCESCASVALMMFGQRMASLTGEARYYEEVERALCNTVLAGINADGLSYFYVNPLELWPENCIGATSMAHVQTVRQRWFSVACCPTNIARTLASLGAYIYAEDDQSLYIHQYISSRVRTFHQGRAVQLDMDADVLGGGRIRITTDVPVQLKIRIPLYAERPGYQVNGRRWDPPVERGYARFDLDRASEVLIDLHISPRWIAANDHVRADAGKNALTVGPFVYCLEETDNGGNLASLLVHPDTPVTMGDRLEELPGNMPRMTYRGYRMVNGVSGLYGPPEYRLESVQLTAVPYSLWCNRASGEMVVWQHLRL